MSKIKSFSRNHDEIEPGLYLQEINRNVLVFDLRFIKPNTGAIITPRLDPIANNGVTSPPWNPADKVKIVKTSFRIQSYP